MTASSDPAGRAAPRPQSWRGALARAYAASGARVLSWVVVSALVYRADPDAFALLALVRATVGILNYTSLGLGPALIHAVAATTARNGPSRPPFAPAAALAPEPAELAEVSQV